MKTFDPIKVIVRYPKTDEGWRDLKKKTAIVHADAVLNSISKINCPSWEKEKLIQAIIDDAKREIDNDHKKCNSL